jgi:DNA primase
MARIPDEEIDRIKGEVSLVRLVESSGVELKRQGKDWHGRCPFHDDKTPSLVVSEEKNLWHCLGACGTGGSVIDWTMRMQGVSFRHAVELLRDGSLSSLAAKEGSEPKPVKRGTTAKLPSELSSSADDQRLMQRVVSYYHATLKQSPEAQDYLRSRGLANAELIDTFQIGFANRTLGYRLPEKNRAEGAALRGRLQTLGILRESGHEHFNGSIVIPIVDAQGHAVQLYGRKLLDNLRAGTAKHLYLPRPHAGVFNRIGITGAKEVILCEALIDALTFWNAGYRNVTSSYGTNGFTDELLAFLIEQKTQRVLIAYDRDAAGDTAALELAPKLMAAGIEAFRVLFPHGLDANEYALKVQPAAKSLGVALRGAQWMGKGAKPSPIETAPEHVVGWRALPSRAAPAEPSAPSEAVPASSLAAEPAPPAAVLPEPTIASPMPEAPSIDVPIEVREHEILILLGDRRWRVRGLSPEPIPGQLKVNLLVSRGDAFHIDTLDLYAARLRGAYLKQAAAELAYPEDTLKRDLGAVLLKLEALQAEAAEKAASVAPAVSMTAEDKAAAMSLLRDPDLVSRIVTDLTALGIVGEDTNKLTGYLAAVSRKQDRPLAVVIQSTSAAGKSALMDAVLSLVPEEERVHYSAMTGQSLFYMGEIGVKHKILAIAEEAGVAEAAYALKILQSQGELTIASTGKDPVSGRLVTHEYRVEGPVMLFLTTTAIEVDEELLNRCLVLTVNESREQTRAIHALQRRRRTLDGLLERSQRDSITRTHQNAQRLLRALPVVNPFAEGLSFIDAAPRNRRDHEKYLSLIEAVTLLHQYQREIKTVQHGDVLIEYLEVTLADIQLANRLARAVLGQSLDELPPQTRRLLHLIEDLVREQIQPDQKRSELRFTRRDVRAYTGWGHTQLKLHLHRLEEMEYLLVHRGSRGGFVYELLYDGQGKDGSPFLTGLIDLDDHAYDRDRSGSGEAQSGSGRLPAGAVLGPRTTA